MVFHQTVEIPVEEIILVVRHVTVEFLHPEYHMGTVKFSCKWVAFILKSEVLSGVLTDQKSCFCLSLNDMKWFTSYPL